MKNITSLRDYSQREERRKRIGGIVIISILMLSTLGFALSMVDFGGNASGTISADEFSFNGQYWVYSIGTQQYYFSHHPDEINFSVQLNKNIADFSGKQLYVDSDIPAGGQEIYNSLGLYASKITEACYGPCEKDLPEKNCTDSLIVLRESEVESIREEDSCIFINGDLKTVDAFLYKVLGIN